MATFVISHPNPTISNLRNILSRIDKQWGLIWTKNKNAVHGNTISAKILFSDTQDKTPLGVEVHSNYHSDYQVQETCEKAKGNGWISMENGQSVSYAIFIDHSQRPETLYLNTFSELDSIATEMGEKGTRYRAYKFLGDKAYNLYTEEETTFDEY